MEAERLVKMLSECSRKEVVSYRHSSSRSGKKEMTWVHILDTQLKKCVSGLGLVVRHEDEE